MNPPGDITVLTIGHSNHPIARFVSLLRTHRVTAIADVRSSPYSRPNPQFNRALLQVVQHLIAGGRSRAGDRVVELGQVVRDALDFLGIRRKKGIWVKIGLGAHRQDLPGTRVDRAAVRYWEVFAKTASW